MTHTIRPAHLVAAFTLLAAAVLTAHALDATAWWTALGLVAPDLVFLGALRARPEAPGLMPRALVRPYNVSHHPLTPVVLGAASVLAGPALTVVAVAWAAHIAWDRGVGYDLRLPDGSIRPRRTARPRLSTPATTGLPTVTSAVSR